MVALLSSNVLSAQSETWFFNSADTISLGIEMHDRESYDSAIAMYEKIHPGDTNYDLALYEKALSLYTAERYEEAIAICRNALKTSNIYNSEFIVNLGNALDELDRPEDAQAVYDSGIAMFPGSHALYYNRAIMHLQKERWEEGIADLKKAIELNPFHASSHFQLGNLALRNGNYTQALMCAGYFFINEPASGRTNAVLGIFNEVVSEKTDLEPIDYDFDPNGVYKRSDRLIASYAALRDNYEIEGDARFPMMKQMYLAMDQIKKIKGKKDFFSMYYLPYYQKVMAEDLFEPYSYLLSVSIENEYYQNLVMKNIEEVKELIDWNNTHLRDYHGVHPLGYTAGGEMVEYFFKDGNDGLSGRQLLDENGKATRNFEFYYNGGAVSSQGRLNPDSKFDGEVTFFHANGKTRKIANYSNGDLQGLSKEFNEEGAPSVFATYTDNSLNGPATVFYSHGSKQREFNFVDGKPVDTIYLYFRNGGLQAAIPQQDGEDNGLGTFYHEDGSLLSKITLKNDERTGPAEFYYPNGQLKLKTSYNEEGEFSGHYQFYHSNGQLQEEGDYIDGVRISNWKTYDPIGNLIREVNFDESGKKTGTETYYDSKGRKTEMFEYKREELVYYETYDFDGQIQVSAKAKRGKINYQELSLDGTLTEEGVFDEDKRIGTWKEYTIYGALFDETSYTEEGEIDGMYKQFFSATGELEDWTSYKRDTLHGPFGSMHFNGQVKSEGTYYNGDRNGLYRVYYNNGQIETERYYVKGKINGPYKFFAPNGDLMRVEYYNMGTIIKIENYWEGALTSSLEFETAMDNLVAKYPNGKTYYDISRTGSRFQGPAKWYYGNGQLEVEGNFVDGSQDGKWTYYFPNGQISRINEYELGDPVGSRVIYHLNGEISETFAFLEGEFHGPNVEYNDRGIRTDSVSYVNGKLDGNRYFYSETGELQHVRVYDLGKIIGWRPVLENGALGDLVEIKDGTATVKASYPNGQVAFEYTMDKGDFRGTYTTYYSNGQVETQLNYEDDYYQGVQIAYYENGQKMRETNYVDGMREGVQRYYHPNGQLAREITWLAGDKQGPEKHYDENGNLLAEYLFHGDDLYE